MSQVSFTLRRPSSKRRHGLLNPLTRASTNDASPLKDYFVSTEENADEMEAIGCDDSQRPLKKPLLLEDAAAKVRRLQDEGNTLAESGRFRAAMSRWHEALGVDDRNAVIYELLAQAAMAMCDDFEAIQYALKATECAPEWGEAYHTLGRCHLNFGELELAKTHFEKACELLGVTEELAADRGEVDALLGEQQRILAQKELEERDAKDADRLQVISCMKNLSLRGQVL